jgi:hypothetical protein
MTCIRHERGIESFISRENIRWPPFFIFTYFESMRYAVLVPQISKKKTCIYCLNHWRFSVSRPVSVIFIRGYVSLNKFKLNADKTVLIIIRSQFRPTIDIPCHWVHQAAEWRTEHVGVYCWWQYGLWETIHNMDLEKQVTAICKSAFYHLRYISRIRKHFFALWTSS